MKICTNFNIPNHHIISRVHKYTGKFKYLHIKLNLSITNLTRYTTIIIILYIL